MAFPIGTFKPPNSKTGKNEGDIEQEWNRPKTAQEGDTTEAEFPLPNLPTKGETPSFAAKVEE